jgi:type IV pilus assembly protein PilO
MKEHKQVILGGIAIVLVMAVMFFFLVGPRRGELAEAKEQVEAAESETVVLETELARLESLQKQAPQLQAALDEISDLVPEENRVSSFVFQVQQEANRSGLDFISITPQLPKTPPEGAPLAEVKIDIGAKGSYFTIQDFIRRLTELDRAVRIDGFSMEAVQEENEEGVASDDKVELRASARVFFEQPAGSVAATVPGTTTTAPEGDATTEAPPASTDAEGVQ